MDRRDFVVGSAGLAGFAALSGCSPRENEAGHKAPAAAGTALPRSSAPEQVRRGDMFYRQLGRTGREVSIVGVGGFHLGNPADPAEATRIVRTAVDSGITFMDNSWDYHDGESEKRMGAALQDGYRQKVFLMTKIDGRTRLAAEKQIDESLAHLKTDHIDLMQFHEVIRMEDPDRIFGEDGAAVAMLAAKKAGKVSFIGFTGHKDPLVHLRMLEVAAAHNFNFDAVLMPLNVMDASFRSFQHQVLPVLLERGIGVLSMKPLGSGVLLESGVVTAIEGLQYAMSLPTSTVINGMDSMDRLEQALQAVRTLKPLNQSEMAALEAKAAKAAATGRYERFKTTDQFDSTAHHPAWLG